MSPGRLAICGQERPGFFCQIEKDGIAVEDRCVAINDRGDLGKTSVNVSSDALPTAGGRQICVAVMFKHSSGFARYRDHRNTNKRNARELLSCLRTPSVRQRNVCGAVPDMCKSCCGSTFAKRCTQTGFSILELPKQPHAAHSVASVCLLLLLPAACCLLPAACCLLLPNACCQLPAACCLLPVACCHLVPVATVVAAATYWCT